MPEIEIVYEGCNITREISPYITGFTFTDNASGKADDISLSIQDRDSLWLTEWTPSKSDKVTASIISGSKRLDCGAFQVDQIEYSYPPRVITIKAVSCAVTGKTRNENHNKAWECVTVKDIAANIAGDSELELFYDAEDYDIERREQIHQPDLAFLEEVCSQFGLNVKVSDGKLIVYNERGYDSHESITEITPEDKRLISVKFSSKSAKIYRKAKVSYHHPVKNEVYEAEYEDEDEEGSEQELEIYTRIDSQPQAEKTAQEVLTSANSKEITADITLLGNIDYMAGMNITLSGFGMFSGKYFIDKVTHSVGSGWTAQLSLKMGGGSKKAVKKYKSGSRKKVTEKISEELLADDTDGY